MKAKVTKETDMSMINTSNAICPLDGRYRSKVEELGKIFGEAGLIERRVLVEITYLFSIAQVFGIDLRTHGEAIWKLHRNFSLEDAAAVKTFERKVNHDVKAVEYWLRQKAGELGVPESIQELIHLALTSEDVNNLAYSLQIMDGLPILLITLGKIQSRLDELAKTHAGDIMIGRTHGQPASPVSFGKEMRVFADRVQRLLADVTSIKLTGKLNGATGTFAAHSIAKPTEDWISFAKNFVEGFGFEYLKVTTQIEPHDTLGKVFDALARVNTMLIDLAQDMWLYISYDLVKLAVNPDEVGSSTMPHKVNPIDFENGIGNLKLANALLMCLARELPVSKMQRDLSDSTMLRNIGVAFGYAWQAYQSVLKGLDKIAPDVDAMQKETMSHPEVLSEAIQTALRAAGVPNGYELVKGLTRRSHALTLTELHAFIDTLPLADDAKASLRLLTPTTYRGLTETLALG